MFAIINDLMLKDYVLQGMRIKPLRYKSFYIINVLLALTVDQAIV